MNDIKPVSNITFWLYGHIVYFFNKSKACFIKLILSSLNSILFFEYNNLISEIRLSNANKISSFNLVDISEPILLFFS